MQFARVYGFVTRRPRSGRWLTVVLDTGRDVRTIRDEAVTPGVDSGTSAWLADQLVQETIGNELALEGWEVIGEGEGGAEEEGDGIGRSSTWILRRV